MPDSNHLAGVEVSAVDSNASASGSPSSWALGSAIILENMVGTSRAGHNLAGLLPLRSLPSRPYSLTLVRLIIIVFLAYR
jgi:hypothetical protein